MSGRFHREIRIDADAFISAMRQFSNEEVGTAIRIISAVAFDGANFFKWDDQSQGAAVGVFSARSWRRLRPMAMQAATALWEYTSIKVRGIRDPVPPWVRAAIFERDGNICSYCTTQDGPFELDHIIPVSRGGDNTAENLCVSCAPCNRSKRDKLVSEWLG